MFKAIGVLLAIYTAYAAWRGEVMAKSGPSGRSVQREDEPAYFWTVIGIYAVLSLALLFWF